MPPVDTPSLPHALRPPWDSMARRVAAAARSSSAAVARALAEQTPDPADRITPPTTILWPEHDPLFSRDWSDKLDDWFAAADLRFVDGIGHFVPLEAPEVFAAALREH